MNTDFLPLFGRLRGREWLRSTFETIDAGEDIGLEDARILYLVFGLEPNEPLWDSDYERDEDFNYFAGHVLSEWITSWFAYWHLDEGLPAEQARSRHWQCMKEALDAA